MAQLLGGTGAFIVLWDEVRGEPVPHAAYGTFDEFYKTLQRWPGEPTLTANVVQLGQPISVYDVLDSEYISPRIAAQFPDKSILGLPLISNNHPIGAVLIGETRYHRVFTESEIQVAMAAANQIASSISNAQLFVKLQTERNRLTDILDSVSDMILVINSNGDIQFANRAFTTITGFSEEFAKNSRVWNFWDIPAEQLATLQAEVIAVVSQGMTWHREFTGKAADQRSYDSDLYISGLHDLNKNLIGYVASSRDITRLKELDRMKTQFVSTVSHELRTPLSVINLYTENLLEFYPRLSDDERRGLLSDIHIETHALHELVEELLSLSRMDSGRAEPKKAQFDLIPLLVETLSSGNSLASIKKVTIDSDLPSRPVPIYADHDQMRQVFRNLIANAVKFTPSGGQVRLTCELSGNIICVQVADTGIGIPQADLPRLFARFFRSENAVRQEIPGTGLGLAITKEILNRHQFSIEVQSELDKGTTFSVSIPLANIEQPTILFVDQDSACQASISKILPADYRVITAADLDQAWAMIKTQPPALVVAALKQIDKRVIDFVQHLRGQEDTHFIPLVTICLESVSSAQHSVMDGIDGFLDYPVSPDDLRELVYRMIYSKKMIG